MIKKGSTRIVNFMSPSVGVVMLGRGHISVTCIVGILNFIR